MKQKNKPLVAAVLPGPSDEHSIAPIDLLNEKEVAATLGIAPGTLRNWRSLRIGVPYVKLGKRTVRYCRADVDAFIARGMTQMEAA